ncbi:MAG: lycopene cyclase domain-containing protein [Burkholderiales bacterium]|nr:lycopene cyclase domain-containing protein [Burkholderiales bacterium]
MALFLYRKDLRHEISVISFGSGFGGIFSQATHIEDWWNPLRLTQTPIGIEDFLIGFSIGGICSVVYAILFNLKVEPNNFYFTKNGKNDRLLGNIFLLSFILLFFWMFYILNISSSYSVLISYLLGISVMLFFRRDLIQNSLISGLITLMLGSLIYYFLMLLFPGFINKFWYLPQVWYSKTFFDIPLGEYIWYFLTGAFIGPLYKFVRNKKTVRITP